MWVVLLNNVEVPVSGLKLQHLGKQPCSGFFPLYLFLSPEFRFAPESRWLPHITDTHIRRRVRPNVFAVLGLIPSNHPLLPSCFHPCRSLSPSLANAFLFLSFPFIQNYSPFVANLQGTPQTFQLFCFKSITITGCSLSRKRDFSPSLFFFSDNLCDICEKGWVLEIATGRGGLGEREKSDTAECIPESVCMWACVHAY